MPAVPEIFQAAGQVGLASGEQLPEAGPPRGARASDRLRHVAPLQRPLHLQHLDGRLLAGRGDGRVRLGHPVRGPAHGPGEDRRAPLRQLAPGMGRLWSLGPDGKPGMQASPEGVAAYLAKNAKKL